MKSEHQLSFQRLDVYRAAKELVRVVHESGVRDAELRDQATRAAKSCFLTLCEGLPSESVAMRRKFFALASGSLCETVGAVDVAVTIGAVDARDGDAVQELAWRLKRMLRALTR